ncbi:hypothetical protein [Vibrio aestuarianus]|uniref:hypothetical protein n=1 Tax=Vibrio aestuarianus TaxID=28171 RepID=UPI00237C6944|nr:hypothetical protein [Vibrio aestuarianus]MDE1340739.1 hypothetical protein [Vibrio aestuarianus]
MDITNSLSQTSALTVIGSEQLVQDNINLNLKSLEKNQKQLIKAEKDGISMNDLLKLLTEILQTSYVIHAEVSQSRIQAAMVTTEIASILAADKRHASTVQFSVQVVAAGFAMATNTFSAYHTAKGTTVKDKHLQDLANSKGGKVSDLTPQEINDHTANLERGATGKYGGFAQFGNAVKDATRDGMEIYHAHHLEDQEVGQATLKHKEKLDALEDLIFQHFATVIAKLNELLHDIAQASLATNR